MGKKMYPTTEDNDGMQVHYKKMKLYESKETTPEDDFRDISPSSSFSSSSTSSSSLYRSCSSKSNSSDLINFLMERNKTLIPSSSSKLQCSTNGAGHNNFSIKQYDDNTFRHISDNL